MINLILFCRFIAISFAITLSSFMAFNKLLVISVILICWFSALFIIICLLLFVNSFSILLLIILRSLWSGLPAMYFQAVPRKSRDLRILGFRMGSTISNISIACWASSRRVGKKGFDGGKFLSIVSVMFSKRFLYIWVLMMWMKFRVPSCILE